VPTLDLTIGGASANSYEDVAGADAYADERLESDAWTAETDADVKARALIQATRRIDASANRLFSGNKATQAQALEFPRVNAKDRAGYAIPENTIPTALQRATSELAILIHAQATASGNDPFGLSGLEGIAKAKVGDLAIEFRDSPGSSGGTFTKLPPSVRDMLASLLDGYGASTVRVSRG